MIESILEFEENNEFEEAFNAYKNLYSKQNLDYVIWKHFFFFLWISIEDAPKEFREKIDLNKELVNMLSDGKRNFSELAEFNFIAGYTVTLFPYEFGDFDILEKQGKEMLLKATLIEPENIIYKMVHLGDLPNVNRKEYEKAVIAAKPIVQKKFNGNGFLNKYFKHVLTRKI
ncbi:hypothetical protein FNO01nite_34120 [Flavobacterium noncentrifugens]|uniref:Uncharacterized protein n=1 Tax=Flavobacterium noncentrifugens TaxID=1128970 RepID=A0A1G9DBH2_9FLAO|nr:hypothetical protein [Flavobacterium noncentrifugens]GEP52740.1 hypothetical protein FNO01nite_34120 [Flavobacterium noncentrifugens]SDK61278.1 hypothetical protein SAMN04487935_3766 [Flavobacterium noncentrifugens]